MAGAPVAVLALACTLAVLHLPGVALNVVLEYRNSEDEDVPM
jgi:hypothetical protein